MPTPPPTNALSGNSDREDDREQTESMSAVPVERLSRTPIERFCPILICLAGSQRGQRFKITGPETVLGRGREADIRVNDGGASRRHAVIHYLNHDAPKAPPTCAVEDLESRNGTELNGKVLRARTLLSERDRIIIGRSVFGFFLRDEEELLQDESLYASATRDLLTGLDNRQQMLSWLKHTMALALRRRMEMCFLLIDIDHFKSVNDTYGHHVGDEALRHIARILKSTSRDSDLVSRWGGEEFAIALPDCPLANGRQAAERLRQAIENAPLQTGEVTVGLTASIGLTAYLAEDTIQVLYERADRALYAAKSAGRNRLVIIAPGHAPG